MIRRIFFLAFFLLAFLGILVLVWANIQFPRTKTEKVAPSSAALLRDQSLMKPADFGRTEQVILTDQVLTDYESTEFVRAILHAGASVFMLTSEDFPEENFSDAWLQGMGFSYEETAQIFVSSIRHETPWLRDYGPSFFSRTAGSAKPVLLDFTTNEVQGLDASVNAELAEMLDLDYVRSEEFLEGGDFLTDGENCFLSVPQKTERFATLQKNLQAHGGCKHLTAFNEIPHPHLDMWAIIVAKGVVLVSEVEDSTLDYIERETGSVARDYVELKQMLDANAKIFAQTMQVKRIPMPLPFRGTLRNYVNALLVNGHAIVPSYRTYGWNHMDDYPDAALHARYEAKVQKIYSELGFKVTFVNADRPLYNGGAWHCMAIQVPDLRPRVSLNQP